MKRKNGFTLIELLVVVAIIAVLIAMLMPALQKARNASIRAQCSSNFHQIGTGLVYYTNDYNGFIPPGLYEKRALSDWTNPMGFGCLQEYFPGSNLGPLPDTTDFASRGLFNCPASEVLDIQHGNFATISYLGYYQYDDDTTLVKKRTFRAGELSSGAALGTGLLAYNPWNPWMGSNGWLMGGAKYYGIWNHKQEGGNILYVDGHVKWRFSKEMFDRARKYNSGLLIVRAAFNEDGM